MSDTVSLQDLNVPDGRVLIGENWLPPRSGGTISVLNPSDGSAFAALARGTADDVDAAVSAARTASRATSSPGTTRCRSSGVRSGRRSPWAMPAS